MQNKVESRIIMPNSIHSLPGFPGGAKYTGNVPRHDACVWKPLRGRRCFVPPARAATEAPSRSKRDWRAAKPIRGALSNKINSSRAKFMLSMLCHVKRALPVHMILNFKKVNGWVLILTVALYLIRRRHIPGKRILQPLWALRHILHLTCKGCLRFLRPR